MRRYLGMGVEGQLLVDCARFGGGPLEQLHAQWTELRGEALDEILVRIHCGPMRAAVSVVFELPQMHNLIDHAGIALEGADQLLIPPALLKDRKAEFLVGPHDL
jgi:hypothetical protein